MDESGRNGTEVAPGVAEGASATGWSRGGGSRLRRDPRVAIERGGDLGADDVLGILCADQVERWRAGMRIPAEAYLALHPTLQGDREAAFELVYGEYVVREALGEAPELAEFLWRFPAFADRLRRQLELHRALRQEDDGDEDDPGGARTLRGEGTGPGPEGVARPWEVPGYEVLAELGRGGMGMVYKARQLGLNRLVALKVIPVDARFDPGAAARFRAEAEAVARFQHPNIVQVYEVGEHEGLGYISLEYAAGGALEKTLAGTPQQPRESARVLETLARAVHYAHERGIVHRDLKPANIVLTAEGVPKVTDFGLAKLLEDDRGLTLAGDILGTPSYMAPEQVRGDSREITPATDVYALGAILYEMLSGRPPFKGATPISTLEQVSGQEPLAPGKFQRHIPRDLETICLKCLEKAPRRRYAGALDLADDLRRFLDGRAILARPVPAWERAWKWARRRPGAAAALATGVVAVVLVVAGTLAFNARLRASVLKARDAERAAGASARAAVEQRNLALKALYQLVFEVQEELGESPATRALRKALLAKAIAGLDELARSAEASAPDLGRAVAHLKLGEIFRQVGRAEDARRQLELSRRLAEDLAAAPHAVDVEECLGRTYLGLGLLEMWANRNAEARRSLRRAVDLAEAVAAAAPDRAAPSRDAPRRALIEAYLQLGRACGFGGDLAEADVWFRKTHEHAQRWVDDEPASLRAREMLSWSYRKLADVRKHSNDPVPAREAYLKAIALDRELLAGEPGNGTFKTHLAVALEDLGSLLYRGRAYAESRPLYEEAERLFFELTRGDPEDGTLRYRLARTRVGFARLERDDWQFAKAAELFRKALGGVGGRRNEGRATLSAGELEAWELEASDCKAVPVAVGPLEAIRARPAREACQLLRVRARAFASRGRHPEFAKALDLLCGLAPERAEDHYEQARSLASCLDLLGDTSSGPDAAPRQRYLDRAVTALRRAAEAGFTDAQRLEADEALKPLRGDTGYRRLIDRLNGTQPQAP